MEELKQSLLLLYTFILQFDIHNKLQQFPNNHWSSDDAHTSIILVSLLAGTLRECHCVLRRNSVSMTFPNKSRCWFILMNCHSSHCFPMVLQLHSFTGAWQIKMMLVWGFRLIQNHSFSRLLGSYSCTKHILTADTLLFSLASSSFTDLSLLSCFLVLK